MPWSLRAALQAVAAPARAPAAPAGATPFGSAEAEAEFGAVFQRWAAAADKAGGGTTSAPPQGIPRFFFGPQPGSSKGGEVHDKLREVSRELHLARKTSQGVLNTELEALWQELETHDTFKDEQGVTRIDYAQFRECGRALAARFAKLESYFTPETFLILRRDDHGRVSINQFFDYVMRKVSVLQVRLTLCLYDVGGFGTLRESDLSTYILDQIPQLPKLAKLSDSFYETYVVYAARKFFFFLDSRRLGRIRIETVLTSDILAEFLELQEEDLPEAYEESNYFSTPFVSRVHGAYIDLDRDGNGLLSRSEFQRFPPGGLTREFVDRIFQERTTYKGEAENLLDYKEYLNFVLARENPDTKQSLAYYYRLLNLNGSGIDSFAISYFWRGIQEHPMMAGMDDISVEVITNEIFDMIKPADPYCILLKDLIRSGKGATVCSILSDVQGLLLYENRESLIPDSAD